MANDHNLSDDVITASNLTQKGPNAGLSDKITHVLLCASRQQHDTTPGAQQCSYLASSAALVVAAGVLAHVAPAQAAALMHEEPANALSLPTWAIHVSSVAEWIVAMSLVWRYAEVTGRPVWKGLTWGMLPLLGGAFCACTYHFFYNSPQLDGLVALQAGLTVLGNATCWLAAHRIYKASQEERPQS